MKVVEVPIESVIPYPNNPRVNDAAVQGVMDSITAFGWQQPIVVDRDMVVIAGHTRLKAAKALGLDKVPITIADLTPDEAAAYRLADNKTGEAAIWDKGKLDLELGNIQLDMGAFGFSDFPPMDHEPDKKQLTCPHCGMGFEA